MSASSNIKIYLRMRPSGRPAPYVSNSEDTLNIDYSKLNEELGPANNHQANYQFRFNKVFGMETQQDDIFSNICQPVLDDVMNGIHGTIFAYGQTGSGKTFTITGGNESYKQRGLIPRTISYMFDKARNQGEYRYKIYISYLEIYNESGYDLISRDDDCSRLEDLPKINIREDEDGNMHLRNLSVNVADTEEDALNLLFLGDTNRVVAETPTNDASTRSHCIFIVWIDATKPGSDVVRRSKFHLVDLAGSERVSKTGLSGSLLGEAKYINLSLHFLEQVIISLHERAGGHRTHVPYRNSMMTSILRDSLGGNCQTVMIGCIAVDAGSLGESMATCRFAARVALIKNNAIINEELDPSLMIKRLRKENAVLKDELKIAQGEEDDEEFGDSAKMRCRELVDAYLQPDDPSDPLIFGTVNHARECLRLLRDMVWALQKAKNEADPQQLQELRAHIKQRDHEISILVERCKDANVNPADRPFIKPTPAEFTEGTGRVTQDLKNMSMGQQSTGSGYPPHQNREAIEAANRERREAIREHKRQAVANVGPEEAAEYLTDKNKAFKAFMKSRPRNDSFEQNKKLLEDLYLEAKGCGEDANKAKKKIDAAKTSIEKLRTARAMTTSDDGASLANPDDPEERSLLETMDQQKKIYNACLGKLRPIKSDIGRLQQLMDQNQKRMQKEFESWYNALRGQVNLSDMSAEQKLKFLDKGTLGQLAEDGDGKRGNWTGDRQTDADIAAYYKAREEIAKSVAKN